MSSKVQTMSSREGEANADGATRRQRSGSAGLAESDRNDVSSQGSVRSDRSPTGSFRGVPPVPEVEVHEPEVSPSSSLRTDGRTMTGKSNMSYASYRVGEANGAGESIEAENARLAKENAALQRKLHVLTLDYARVSSELQALRRCLGSVASTPVVHVVKPTSPPRSPEPAAPRETERAAPALVKPTPITPARLPSPAAPAYRVAPVVSPRMPLREGPLPRTLTPDSAPGRYEPPPRFGARATAQSLRSSVGSDRSTAATSTPAAAHAGAEATPLRTRPPATASSKGALGLPKSDVRSVTGGATPVRRGPLVLNTRGWQQQPLRSTPVPSTNPATRRRQTPPAMPTWRTLYAL